MNSPSIDIVVLNYNGKIFLDDCFQSLAASTYANKHVYLLDNASTQPDVAYVKETYPWVKIIQNPNNNGYCAAYNLAFAQCTSKYLICLNNDVIVDKNWLEPLIELAESDENIAAIQPKILSSKQPEYLEYAGASGGMLDKYGFPFMRGRLFDTVEKDLGQYNDTAHILWASGASMMVRKSALEKAGTLDEIIVHHMDEIDLCWRFRLAGFDVRVQPNSFIYHVGGATIKSRSFKKTYWNHRNSIYMMLKNYGSSNMVKRTLVHILLDYIAFFQSLFTLQFNVARGILAAHLWILGNLSLIAKERQVVQSRRVLSDAQIDKYLFQGSVVWAYFFKGIKTYTQLINQKQS
ncbi:MAG: glycosyl transferase family 2 [Bacteroidetes bacterium B1(2017)]|nr:MAG: glycosyl transferase family 2 [Bacteroidetes bacterium B1(2017)]